MDIVISLVSQLGPWGFLGLCAILGSSGIIALVVVFRYLPKREQAHEAHVERIVGIFREEMAAQRMLLASITQGFGTRLDRIEIKIDALQPCQHPRLYEIDPDPGDCA